MAQHNPKLNKVNRHSSIHKADTQMKLGAHHQKLKMLIGFVNRLRLTAPDLDTRRRCEQQLLAIGVLSEETQEDE